MNKTKYIIASFLFLICTLYVFGTDNELDVKDTFNCILEYILIGCTFLYLSSLFILDKDKIKPKYFLAFHSLIIIGWIFLAFKNYLVFNGDNFHYIINGRSLYETGEIRDSHLLDAPRSAISPPFLPFLISFIYSIIGESFLAMKLLIALLYLSSSIFFFTLLNDLIGRKHIALALSIITFSSPFLLHSSSMIMTETPFLFTSIGSLMVFQKFIQEKTNSKRFYLLLCLAIFSSLLVYFSRAIGLCLIPTYLLFLLRDIQFKGSIKNIINTFECRRFILFTALTLVAFGGRFIYENQTSDIDKNKEITEAFNIDKITKTVESQITVIPVLIDQNLTFRKYANFAYELDIEEQSNLWNSIYLLLVIGIAILLYKNNFVAYYLIFGFLVLSIGSKVTDLLAILRYMSIFLPLYFYVTLVGLEFIVDKLGVLLIPKKMQSGIIKHSILALSLFTLYSSTTLGLGYLVRIEQEKKISNTPYHISQSNFFDLAKWCRNNIDNDGQYIMSRKPRMFTVYSELPSCGLLRNKNGQPLNSEKIFKDLKEKKVKYILIDTFSRLAQQVMVPLVNSNKKQFRLIKQVGTDNPSYLFEVIYKS